MLRLISDKSILKRDTKISRVETEDCHNPATQKSVEGGQIFVKTTKLRIWSFAKDRWQFERLLSRVLTPQLQQQDPVTRFSVLLSSLLDTIKTLIPSEYSIP